MIIDNYKKNHDIDDILFIDMQAVEDFIDKINNKYTQDDLLDIEKHYIRKDGAFFIGTINNKIIAMCGYIPIDNHTVELKRLRVEKNYRGQGLGKQMLKYVEKYIKLKGYKYVIFTTASLRKKTINFYLNNGYIKTGTGNYDKITTVDFKKELII